MAGGRTRSSPSKGDAQTHMTPHLVRNDESPQDLQNLQGTTAAASTSAASAIAAIAAAAATTATTATMVGEVGNADPVDDESAKEDHGDGEVGDADPVHDESAEQDHNIMSNSYNWIVKGVEELDKEKIHHMNAFYALEVDSRKGIHIHPHDQGVLQRTGEFPSPCQRGGYRLP